jgi:hypothetical protein
MASLNTRRPCVQHLENSVFINHESKVVETNYYGGKSFKYAMFMNAEIYCIYQEALSEYMYSFHAFTWLAVLCLKLCHLKDKYIPYFTVLTEKGQNEIRV